MYPSPLWRWPTLSYADKLRRTARLNVVLMLLVFPLVTACLAAQWTFQRQIALLESAPRAQARILKREKGTIRFGARYLTYRYRVDGRDFEFTRNFSDGEDFWSGVEPESMQPLRYDPDDPGRHLLEAERGIILKLRPLVWPVIGLVLVPVVLCLLLTFGEWRLARRLIRIGERVPFEDLKALYSPPPKVRYSWQGLTCQVILWYGDARDAKKPSSVLLIDPDRPRQAQLFAAESLQEQSPLQALEELGDTLRRIHGRLDGDRDFFTMAKISELQQAVQGLVSFPDLVTKEYVTDLYHRWNRMIDSDDGVRDGWWDDLHDWTERVMAHAEKGKADLAARGFGIDEGRIRRRKVMGRIVFAAFAFAAGAVASFLSSEYDPLMTLFGGAVSTVATLLGTLILLRSAERFAQL